MKNKCFSFSGLTFYYFSYPGRLFHFFLPTFSRSRLHFTSLWQLFQHFFNTFLEIFRQLLNISYYPSSFTGAPSWGLTGAPSWGSTGAPSWGLTGAPSRGLTGAPSWGLTGAPSRGLTGAPFRGY